MEKLLSKRLQQLEQLDSNVEKYLYASSILRSLLQTGLIVCFEFIERFIPSGEIDVSNYKSRMGQPSDGLPVEALDYLLPHLRHFLEPKFADGWFEKLGFEKNLSRELNTWVEFRNKTTGHGHLDQSDANLWSKKAHSLIKRLINCFEYILPKVTIKGQFLNPIYENLNIKTKLTHNDQPFIITKIASKNGLWKMSVQTLCYEKKQTLVIDLPIENVFITKLSNSGQDYDLSEIHVENEEYAFFHNIPVPQTTTFEGRDKEINELTGWLLDEDSRVCLIFGDGGYGKTTLILEFLNKLKNDELDLKKPLPGIISYHTSKMTRWTDGGLIHLKGKNNVVEDCVRQLMTLFESPLNKSWYTLSGKPLIQKAEQLLVKNGYKRDDVLLIIDNAETLAASPSDVKELAITLNLIKKTLARVIITSRRKETIEAAPIEVKELSETEAVSLITRLANEYEATPINQAGSARIKRLVKQLMYKPLLIDCLVRYIARTKEKIDVGLETLFGKSNDELLEFLYEDAWLRIGDGPKKVFKVLVSLSCQLNNDSISKICQEVGVQISEFMDSLDETYFGGITDYGYRFELELVPLAESFFNKKISKLCKTEQSEIKESAQNVDRYIAEKVRVEQAYKSDRVAEAFKSEWAKAAKVTCDSGDYPKAKEHYEMALLDDPYNAALYDRYALFLLNRLRNIPLALKCATKSVELDKDNGDSYLTLAMIYYRKDDLENGDKSIDLALMHGKSKAHCSLAMGVARYHFAIRNIKSNKSKYMLEEAISILRTAFKLNSKDDRYYEKNIEEISKYTELALRRLNRLKLTK
jgi:tetratricopeptide (TPR) repeat protein